MLYGHQLLPVEVPLLEETEARDLKYPTSLTGEMANPGFEQAGSSAHKPNLIPPRV